MRPGPPRIDKGAGGRTQRWMMTYRNPSQAPKTDVSGPRMDIVRSHQKCRALAHVEAFRVAPSTERNSYQAGLGNMANGRKRLSRPIARTTDIGLLGGYDSRRQPHSQYPGTGLKIIRHTPLFKLCQIPLPRCFEVTYRH